MLVPTQHATALCPGGGEGEITEMLPLLQCPWAAWLDVNPGLSGMVLTPVPAIESFPSRPGSGVDLSSPPWSWALSGMREHCPARSLGPQGQLSHQATTLAESGQRPPWKPRQAPLRSSAPPLPSAPRRTHLASAPNSQAGTHVAMTPCPSWVLPREAEGTGRTTESLETMLTMELLLVD